MKKQTSILAIICISLFMLSFAASAGVTAPTITGWTYSEDLREGDYMEWRVEYTNNSVPVTTLSNDGPPFVNGSYIQAWVDQDPYGLIVDETTDHAVWSNYFQFSLDGNGTMDPEFFPAFVFPNVYFTSLGDYNVFHYVDDFGFDFIFFDNEEVNTTSYSFNNGEFEAQGTTYHIDGRNVTETFRYDEGSGVLHSYERNEVLTDGTFVHAFVYLTQYDESGDDFFEFASFDPSLDAGDSFSWDVIVMKVDGVNITTSDEQSPVLGSLIKIDVVGEPEDISFTDESLNVTDYLRLYLDGEELIIQEVFDGPDEFIQFIFPKVFDFGNGTVIDFFEFAATNPLEVWDDDETQSVTSTLSGGVFHLELTETGEGWTSVLNAEWDAENGVMINLYRSESNNGVVSYEMQLVRVGTEVPTTGISSNNSSESTGDIPLPGFEFLFILPALIAIPIIRRK